jgi:hypothetical protein
LLPLLADDAAERLLQRLDGKVGLSAERVFDVIPQAIDLSTKGRSVLLHSTVPFTKITPDASGQFTQRVQIKPSRQIDLAEPLLDLLFGSILNYDDVHGRTVQPKGSELAKEAEPFGEPSLLGTECVGSDIALEQVRPTCLAQASAKGTIIRRHRLVQICDMAPQNES